MASITSSDRRLSASKRRLKPPLLLRDYLLDDLSSCSSNGFKSFPRRHSGSSSVRLLLDADINLSRFHHNKRRLSRSRTTCGTALGYAVQKASTVFLNAVKLLPFPSSVKPPPPTVRNNKRGFFSRSFSKRILSRSFWRKSDDQRDSGEIVRRVESDSYPEKIQRWRSFAEFLQESLNEPSYQISSVAAAEEDAELCISGESSSSRSGSEYFGSSEVVQSSSWSGESEVWIENDAVEEGMETSSRGSVVMARVGESVGAHVGDESSVNRSTLSTEDNRKECVKEEKEQLSPVSVLECPFEDEDDASSISLSYQEETSEKIGRRSRRFGGLVRLEPLDLEKRIEWYTGNEKDQISNTSEEEEEEVDVDEAEKKANDLFALVKSRIDVEANTLLSCNAADNVLLDFFQEDTNEERRDAETLVKIAEEWVLGIRQEEMYMSWEVREKREVYVKEMDRREKWCCSREERESVVDDLGNGFFTALLEELLLDLSSFS